MDVGMVGIVAIVFAWLTAPRLGWDAQPALRVWTGAAILFAVSIAIPSFAVLAREAGWVSAGAVAAGLGAYLLFLGLLKIRRLDVGA